MNGSEITDFRPAPDFELADRKGRPARLSSYKGIRKVVLISNRGFLWPFCPSASRKYQSGLSMTSRSEQNHQG